MFLGLKREKEKKRQMEIRREIEPEEMGERWEGMRRKGKERQRD